MAHELQALEGSAVSQSGDTAVAARRADACAVASVDELDGRATRLARATKIFRCIVKLCVVSSQGNPKSLYEFRVEIYSSECRVAIGYTYARHPRNFTV